MRKTVLIFILLGIFIPLSLNASQDVLILQNATKIAQLIGDYDRELGKPTVNLTYARYKILGTDLGVPFEHNGSTYLLFGDTVGGIKRDQDLIAYSTDSSLENGLILSFYTNASRAYKALKIPGISQGAFEVPMEGVSASGNMYVYSTTDYKPIKQIMGRSVVSVSYDNGQTFKYLYDFSKKHFINVSIVKTDSARWPGLPQSEEVGLIIFGSGPYRKSDVYLAFQPEDQIESPQAISYFSGLDNQGKPAWSLEESDAQPLFHQPCVGELSVSYNSFIDKWIMLYNCPFKRSRGINMRTADNPWGPWSEPQIIFDPFRDKGYGYFIHAARKSGTDKVNDPGRENEWGGEYGPYQFEHLATGSNGSTTIYFTMSTWNPYTVVLMKAILKLNK